MHSIRHLSPCIRAFDSPRVCLVVTPEVAVFLFGWCLKFMITSIGGDFTRGSLSLPLSHSAKVKGGKSAFRDTPFLEKTACI